MPWKTMKEVPKNLKTAGLTLSQANKWAEIFDASGSAAIAWTQFKKLYKKVGGKWKKK